MMESLQKVWLKGSLRVLEAGRRYKNLKDDESGVTAVEYAVMLVLVAIAIITLTPDLRQTIVDVFTAITDELSAGLVGAGGGGS